MCQNKILSRDCIHRATLKSNPLSNHSYQNLGMAYGQSGSVECRCKNEGSESEILPLGANPLPPIVHYPMSLLNRLEYFL